MNIHQNSFTFFKSRCLNQRNTTALANHSPQQFCIQLQKIQDALKAMQEASGEEPMVYCIYTQQGQMVTSTSPPLEMGN